MTTPSVSPSGCPLESTDPFSLKTVHWTVFQSLKLSLSEGGKYPVLAAQ